MIDVTPSLALYAVFHLNLVYSSIEEEQQPEVIRRCYWPLLRLVSEHNLPLGIEASGHTLEVAAALDPDWLAELRRLVTQGTCEFIGSGYTQLIGPLVPASVNAANQRLGHQTYDRLLGVRPQVALINEQAYSSGLLEHYLEAGYRAIIMEWDNPAHHHPDWCLEWRYLPQFACGQHGEAIPLIWNQSIAFQKFQRYAHDEMGIDDYLEYLRGHLGDGARAFPLYGNDAEIFDFRPGRYEMESAPCAAGEWRRIEYLLATLRGDGHFQFIRPSQVLELLQAPGAGNRLRLGSPEQPIPVKKQGKYNITRWSVTGRDDLGINTACWRICAALETRPGASDDDWRQLCRLWSSDFRTHITATRWNAYRRELVATERAVGVQKPRRAPARKLALLRAAPPCASLQNRVERDGRFLTVETDAVKVRLNCRRGLAIDALWFQGSSLNPWCGTLNHGYYDDIQWGADFYTGHVILEVPGRPKVTDLNPVEPVVIPEPDRGSVRVEGEVITPLGPIRKTLRIGCDAPQVELCYWLGWRKSLSGSLRVGHFTLNPLAFDRNTLFYRTHNGGKLPETFRLRGTDFDHGSPVSSLVSASQALGMTEQLIDIGDARHAVRVEVDKQSAALIGMITYRTVGNTYFLRLALSAGELDETRHAAASTTRLPLICRISKAEG